MANRKKYVKSIIYQDLQKSKAMLQQKLKRFAQEGESRYYKRRLDKIFEIMKERCFYEGKPLKVLQGADFYQKIELFMNYDAEHYKEDEVYELIAEVFKSLYMNFLLAYLEEDDYIPIPYIGRIKIKEINRYSEFHKMNIKKHYGIVKLDRDVTRDLRLIDKGEKIDLIQETMDETEKLLKEKIS